MSTTTSAPNANRPVHSIRHRRLKVAIWCNQTETGPMYNVTASRSYKTEDGWHESSSFSFDDLMNLAKLLADAHTYIAGQLARQSIPAAGRRPRPQRSGQPIL